MTDLMAHFGEYHADPGWTFWHGTPDIRNWGHGAHYGIHVGTEEAARQALHAKIGEPAEGTWDGTREYGKTLLKGQRPGLQSGYNMERRPDHYPRPATYHEPVLKPGEGWSHGPPVSFEDRKPGKVYNSVGAVYSDSSPVPMDARPHIFPVRIKGPMTNHPAAPHEDFKANGYMAGALKRGNAKRGYFYRNVGEDEGSISAVVPSAGHLERLDEPKTAGLIEHFAAWHEGPHYHGTSAELEPGALIEPNKYPPSSPDDPWTEEPQKPREHTYFSPRRNYVTEHYGPNVYEVEPEGEYKHDPEYGSSRNMFRSKHPLRVKRKVSGDWGRHEGLLAHFAGFDWSGLTHGRYDVPTEAVHALRQHEQRNSGKHPHLADEVAERGIEQPLEVSLHDDGRVVLRGGSHRVNIAHDRGHPTVPVQVVDMRKVSLLEHFGAAEEGFPNPYHGTVPGGRPEFGHTWFHGTKNSGPQLSEGRPEVKRWSEHESWPQPNKLLGTHFSPLHSVAHGFAFPQHGSKWTNPPTPGEPSALVHAKLHFKDPAHFPSEDHLNLAIARWADRESPHWHDPKVNKFLAGSYQDTEGTHKDWHQEPRDLKHHHYLATGAQHVMSWHPHLPEILKGFTDHLHSQGHHGITYGNQVEGPFGSVSAIATHPSQIETTHVEHIAAPDREPEGHEVHYSRPGDVNHTPSEPAPPADHPASSDLNESDEFHGRIDQMHTGQHKGGYETYPRKVELAPGYREHHEAKFGRPKSEFEDYDENRGDEEKPPGWEPSEDWSQGFPGHPHVKKKRKRKKAAARPALYHSGGKDFPGDEEWVHVGTREAAVNRAKDWHEERARRGAPPAQAYLHTVKLAGQHSPSTETDAVVNQPDIGRHFLASGHTVVPYTNEYEDPGSVSYLAHHSAVSLLKTEPLTGKTAAAPAYNGPWYHGSAHRFKAGDLIEPGYHKAHDVSSKEHVYLAASESVARTFGGLAAVRNKAKTYGIYQVEPTGPTEPDPDGMGHRSSHPLRVVRLHERGSSPEDPNPWWNQPGTGKGYPKQAGKGDDFTERTGYVECDQGHTHWGPHGASFLLLRHKDETDGQHRYLLQKRTSTGWTDHGGTWALPGGALQHDDEDSYAAARRESAEEMGSLPRTHHHHTVRDDHGGWFADTHVADVEHRFQPKKDAKTGYEAEGHAWFTHPEIQDLKESGSLHPGFAKTWDTVRRSRVDKTAAATGRSWDQIAAMHPDVYGGSEGSRISAVAFNMAFDRPGMYDGPGPPGRALSYHRARVPLQHVDYARHQPGNEAVEAARERYAASPESVTPPVLVHRHGVYLVADGAHRAEGAVLAGRSHIDAYVARSPHADEPFSTGERAPRHGAVPERAIGRTAAALYSTWDTVRRSRTGKTAAARSQQYVKRMHPKDLVPYARQEAYRTDDEGGMRHRQELAQSFREKGYKPSLHGGMSGDKHYWPVSSPITLVHEDGRSYLEEGHHRTMALDDAGYDKPVPVLVKDFRTREAVLHPDKPDYAHGMQSGGSQVEWVRREKLQKYMEFHHDRETGESHYLPTGHKFPDRYSKQRWDEMDKSVAEHGMHEPILLEYNPWTRKMHIGEGHHRLESAGRAGHEMVPVWGLKTSQEHAHAKPVPGEPKVKPEHFEGGYFPSSFKPSDVLPEHWMKSQAEREQDEWLHPKNAVITPGSLPASQQAAFDEPDLREHRRQMLDVAKNPPPGTRVWRGEMRNVNEHPADAESTGMHWSVNPDSIIGFHKGDDSVRRVVWQGVVEDHEKQAFPRSHPMWRGRHESYGHEAEVRFKPGAKVKLEGAYVDHSDHSPGYLVPQKPERTSQTWKWHPLDHHIEIRHAGHGAADYSELGIPREAAWFGKFLVVEPAMVP